MKKILKYLNDKHRKNERQKVLDNFYTKQMKNGKTMRADILDKISLGIIILIGVVIVISKLIKNFFISIFLGLIFGVFMAIYLRKLIMESRNKKIKAIQEEYRVKLEEEKVISSDEDIEDYIIDRYYEKKEEAKKSFNFLSKDKIFKLYSLAIIFYITGYLSVYPMYYKSMAIVSFILATFIGSYNITEYIKKSDNKDLLN
ncbi:hypothetical protein RBU61_10450 [Tissierella sp. MB52-C2]|uniref:hypothetical protein n=1 Tax=Tissierella sp. MB52-C2 TaxID=3070999 RepID=UPI00280BBA44|nr:hypothetical protein [Tissierella sp. MB52-C2]WMM23376.1 hypothetical protein RBU61_10450 [Tissierella sp. MB52-C2]